MPSPTWTRFCNRKTSACAKACRKDLRSKGYNQGRFVVDEGESELSEHGVHHFQELLLDALERVKNRLRAVARPRSGKGRSFCAKGSR